MSSPFASNVPVSEPKRNTPFKAEVDLGGFAWDSNHGIFIPIYQEVDRFEPPHPPVSTARRGK